MDAPVAGGKRGVGLDAAVVVTHPRRGKTEALDGRRTAGGDQNVRTRDRFFMPGGGDENPNAIAPRLDPRNPLATIVYSVTEPILRPIRQALPPIGGLDLSPMVLLLGLQVLKSLLF